MSIGFWNDDDIFFSSFIEPFSFTFSVGLHRKRNIAWFVI